jgi:hypothetical protein
MKLNIKEALAEYGVTGDVVSCGDNADWASGLHALTSKQRQQVRLCAQGTCAGVALVDIPGRASLGYTAAVVGGILPSEQHPCS